MYQLYFACGINEDLSTSASETIHCTAEFTLTAHSVISFARLLSLAFYLHFCNQGAVSLGMFQLVTLQDDLVHCSPEGNI
jgi:hypothetical protein